MLIAIYKNTSLKSCKEHNGGFTNFVGDIFVESKYIQMFYQIFLYLKQRCVLVTAPGESGIYICVLKVFSNGDFSVTVGPHLLCKVRVEAEECV